MPINRTYVSVSFFANLAVFVFFAIVMILDIIRNWNELYESLSFFEESLGKSESNIFVIILFLLSFYIPFVLYLIRLNFSLMAFETKRDYFLTYIDKLHPFLKVIEWILRFFVFIMLLLGISQIFTPFNSFIENIFYQLNIPLKYYGYKEGGLPYFDLYKSLIPLRDTVLYIIFFFSMLIVWDSFLYIFNCLCKNRLPLTDFFKRFILNHFIGLMIWILLALILFWTPINLLFFKNSSIGTILLFVLSMIYSWCVFKSLKSIKQEFSIALIRHHDDT